MVDKPPPPGQHIPDSLPPTKTWPKLKLQEKLSLLGLSRDVDPERKCVEEAQLVEEIAPLEPPYAALATKFSFHSERPHGTRMPISLSRSDPNWDPRNQTHTILQDGTMLPAEYVCREGHSYYAATFTELYRTPQGLTTVTCTHKFVFYGLINVGYKRSAIVQRL